MSQQNNVTVRRNKIVIKPLKTTGASPIIIRKRNMIDLFKGENSGQLSIKNMKFGTASSLYKEDLIYDSKDGELLWDSPMKVTIVNKYNLLTNSSRTTATYFELQGKVSKKTSDQIIKVIGQKNYDTVLAALCSGVLPEEVKAQAVVALLKDTTFEDRGVQTETCNLKMEFKDPKDVKVNIKMEPTEDKCCQTDENCMDMIYNFKPKKNVKRRSVKPYVVKDVPVKIVDQAVPNPETSENKRIIEDLDNQIKFETKDRLPEPECILPELHFNEESDTDLKSDISISCDTVVLRQAENQIMTSVGKRTMNFQPSKIALPDGTIIMVPVKPEDDFHIATPEILNNVLPEERTKLLWYQAYIDWRRCLEKDADGYLPLHNAVLNKDVDLVKRQCVVLKTKHESLDITNADNMTPLQMSIMQDSIECTTTLLQYGADPLYPDEEHRASIHLAAEGSSDHLRAILNHCQSKARDVLLYHEEELWKPEYEMKTNKELGAILVRHMCKMVDSQGYTPLMLAAKMGNYTNVKMLVESTPECVNAAMPNCGNTALFLATAEACLDAARRGNKSKVTDHYHRTITILVENGANPTIPNYAGTSVNDLLAESNNAELSMLFGNTLTAVKYLDGAMPPANFDKYMLLKNEKGDVDLADLKKRTRKSKGSAKETEKVKEKPKILANIPVTKRVVIDPGTVIRGDIKIISPKDKLITVKSTPIDSDVMQNTSFTVVTGIPNKTFLSVYQTSSLVQDNQNPDLKVTEIPNLPTTSAVAGKVGSQTAKRKTASQTGSSKRSLKKAKADTAGVSKG